MKCCVFHDLVNPQFEVLWISYNLRDCLVDIIVLGAIYHPPGSDNRAMTRYLTDCLTSAEAMHKNCGIIIMEHEYLETVQAETTSTISYKSENFTCGTN